jgi:anti-sigma regulatory factor (Ser/Thr protein kinase)
MFPDLAAMSPAAPVLVSRSAALAGADASAAAARRLAAEALDAAGNCPAAHDAAAVVSELTANAVRHTRSGRGGEVRVTVASAPGKWVLILVGDDGPDESGTLPAIPAQPSASAESGRGLLMVTALSDAYGYAGGLSWAVLSWEGPPTRPWGATGVETGKPHRKETAMARLQINVPRRPTPRALLSANPSLSSTDMRDLLIEFGVSTARATRLTQNRREAEWRRSGQR